MRPLGKLIPFRDALAMTLAEARATARTETVPLAHAQGRILAADLSAPFDIPLADRAAMDGYALRASDADGASPGSPVPLPLAGASMAGSPGPSSLAAGHCAEIATGAVVPDGADAVVEVERTTERNGRILLSAPVEPGRNILRRGSDVARGAGILSAGTLLTPGRVAAAAAAGQALLSVLSRPRVGVLSTGDEIRRLGAGAAAPLAPHEVYDSNAAGLAALAARCGCEAVLAGPVADDPDRIGRALDGLAGCEIAVFTGGTSAGSRDFTVDLVRARGEVRFHGVAVRPGKPLLLGRVGASLVLGMPGFPASCMLTGEAVLAPALRRLAGLPEPPPLRALLAEPVVSARGRTDLVPVALSSGTRNPEPEARSPLSARSVFRGSSAVSSLSGADGWILVEEETERLETGSGVDVRLF